MRRRKLWGCWIGSVTVTLLGATPLLGGVALAVFFHVQGLVILHVCCSTPVVVARIW
jgi:hypothetical protein